MPSPTPERAIPDDSRLCWLCKLRPGNYTAGICGSCYVDALRTVVCGRDSAIIREMREQGKGG